MKWWESGFRVAMDAEFEESKHPREHGQFASGGGGATSAQTPLKAKKSTQELSAGELQKAYERAEQDASKIADELIAAGRGQEKYQETAQKDDPLSVKYIEASKRHRALYDEMQARRAYHGGRQPIKRK